MKKIMSIIRKAIEGFDDYEKEKFKKKVLPLVWDEFSVVIDDNDSWTDVFLKTKDKNLDATEMLSCVISDRECFPTVSELQELLKRLLHLVDDVTGEIVDRSYGFFY